MAPDFVLIIEREECTLSAFIEANTDDGELQIAADELAAIQALQPGESTLISVHAGWLEVARKAEKREDKFKRRYETVEAVDAVLAQSIDLRDVANLYYVNAELVESSPELKARFLAKKHELLGSHKSAA